MQSPGTIMTSRRPVVMPATKPMTVMWLTKSSRSSAIIAARHTSGSLPTAAVWEPITLLIFFLKHPDVFEGTIALSGLYRLDRTEFGLSAGDIPAVYYNSPLNYFPELSDPWYLKRYRHSNIIVCVGQGAWEEEAVDDTRHLDVLLKEKSIPAWIDFWGTDVNHDWPWWYKQMNYFLEYL